MRLALLTLYEVVERLGVAVRRATGRRVVEELLPLGAEAAGQGGEGRLDAHAGAAPRRPFAASGRSLVVGDGAQRDGGGGEVWLGETGSLAGRLGARAPIVVEPVRSKPRVAGAGGSAVTAEGWTSAERRRTKGASSALP